MARPVFSPTASDRRLTSLLFSYGLSDQQVARALGIDGIDVKTMRKHLAHEMQIGRLSYQSAVASATIRSIQKTGSPRSASAGVQGLGLQPLPTRHSTGGEHVEASSD